MTTDIQNAYAGFEFEPLRASREFHVLQSLLQKYSTTPPIALGNRPIYFYGHSGQLTMDAFRELAAKSIYYWLAGSGKSITSPEFIHVTRNKNFGIFYSLNFKVGAEHYVIRISKEASERDFRIVIRRDLTPPFGPALPHNSAPVLWEKIARLDGLM